MISDLIDRAVGFAARAHEGQQRKNGDMPFIAHPVGVAMLLQRMGCDDVTVAAELLHDTVEDTTATMADIRAEFGDEVANIVAGCSEPKDRSWEARKQHAIDAFRDAPLRVKLVAAADKYHNLYHLMHNREKLGEAVWQPFTRGPAQQAWYYRTVTQSLMENVADVADYPIFAALEDLVERIFDSP